MNREVRETLLKLARENPSSEYVFVHPKTGRPYRCIKRAFKKARRRRSSRWRDEKACPISAPRQKRPPERVAVNR
jgi:hypothetical protein